MHTHDLTPLSAVWFVCFCLGVLCSILVSRSGDPEKIRKETNDKLAGLVGSPWLPRRVLTSTGVRFWWAQWFFYGAAAVFFSIYGVLKDGG